MRSLIFATVSLSLFCFQAGDCNEAVAQLARSSNGDEIVSYQPTDPWRRSRWFNLQTGNSGKYYNCDGEQDKRYSPYICWKADTEPMTPTLFEPLNIWRQQMDEVRQRIADGSCAASDCGCNSCQQAVRNGQPAGCSTCQGSAAHSINNSVVSNAAGVRSSIPLPVIDPAHGSKFGLVRGKIIEPVATERIAAPVVNANRKTSVATKPSLLDQFREMNRR